MGRVGAAALPVLAGLLIGCGPSAPVDLDPPAAPGALAPSLARQGDRLLASWLEPLDGAAAGHRLVVARLEGEAWSEPFEVRRGDDFFANWADVPGVVAAGDGSLLAHWLAKVGEDTYAYAIFLARSTDGGERWAPLGTLNDDEVESEHGFVSWVPEGDGARAIWLDGRELPAGGAMALRTARVGAAVEPSRVLDERVCECCPTDLAVTARGPLAVYRDRSPSEVRNMGLVAAADETPAPRILHDDGWRIPGCPVNGPAIDAAGDAVAVAWFTAPDGEARVSVAFSSDGGETFGAPQRVDLGRPLGRADLQLVGPGEAVVSWLEAAGDRAELRLRRASAASGPAPGSLLISATTASRASGVPRLLRLGDLLYLAWVETAEGTAARLRLRAVPVAAV